MNNITITPNKRFVIIGNHFIKLSEIIRLLENKTEEFYNGSVIMSDGNCFCIEEDAFVELMKYLSTDMMGVTQ